MSAEGMDDHRLFLLLRWIPGQQKKTAEFSRRDAYSIGQYMAKLHLSAEDFVPPEGFLRPRWDWKSLFDEEANYWNIAKVFLSEEEVSAVRSAGERIREDLLVIGEAREEFGMIHRDLQPGNIVFHQGVIYAIDFDHCGWGYYMYDVALLHLLFENLGEHRERMQEALLDGYQSLRALPENHRAMLETFMDMHVMIRFIRTLGKLRAAHPGETHAYPEHRFKQLRHMLNRLTISSSTFRIT
jgi:Ser/Thr protein kinase RdoA (MazF antagonist)